ncbi:MAG: 30S ribosomal protein S2, partial [Betaproteobacteria bacterium]|nr:30S ribosomal protein S2 [Betaproteobacteria bacterium]
QAAIFCMTVARNNGTVMFVCTKRSGAELTTKYAEKCNMPYVNHRWLGGLLSNFETVRMSMRKMEDYEEKTKPANLRLMTKREGLRMLARLERLRSSLSGVRNMSKLPDALFVIDAGLHRICVSEAKKIGIPVAAVVDSNYSPKGIDYIIPGNDDSTHATEIYLKVISESILIGKNMAASGEAEEAKAD